MDSRSSARNIAREEDKQLGNEANSEHREVTAAAVSKELRFYARQRWPLENDKSRKSELRRLLKLTARRIKSLWEGEETAVPRGTETARIETLIGHKIGAVADEENRDVFMALQARVSRLEAALAAVDEAFFDPQVAALRYALHGRRGADVTDTINAAHAGADAMGSEGRGD